MNLLAGMMLAIAIVALAWVVLVVVIWLHRPSRALAGPALRLIPDLIRLTRSLLADRTTPRRVKVALGGLLIYLLSPIDLIPDFIPVLGSVDDLAITALVLRWAGRRVGPTELRRHWTGTNDGFELLQRFLGTAR